MSGINGEDEEHPANKRAGVSKLAFEPRVHHVMRQLTKENYRNRN